MKVKMKIIIFYRLLTISIFLFSTHFLKAQWNTTSFTPLKPSSIHMVNASKGWMVGNGRIEVTNDGGITWSLQFSILQKTLSDVQFVDQNIGWVVGSQGSILQTTDGGMHWATQHAGTSNSLNGVFFLNTDLGWAVGARGTILKTINGGKNWTLQSSGTTSSLAKVFFIDDMNGWVAGAGVILHTKNGGLTWSSQLTASSKSFQGIQFCDASKGWAITGNGEIMFTNDSGKVWTSQLKDNYTNFKDLQFLNATTGWVIGSNGKVYHTNDGGITWISSQVHFKTNFGIHFIDSSHGWVVGGNNMISITKDGGSTWSTHTFGNLNQPLNGIQFVSPSDGWAIGEEGLVMKTNDSGQTWHRHPISTLNVLTDIQFVNSNVGWIVGDLSTILHTKDGGNSWVFQDAGIDSNVLTDVHFLNEHTGWAVGGNKILHTTNGGVNWTVQQNFTNYNFLTGIYFNNANEGYCVGRTGYQGVILKTEDGGRTWIAQASNIKNIPLTDIFFINKNVGWASGSKTLLKTLNGGQSWIRQQLPDTNTYIRAVHFITPDTGWVVGSLNSTSNGIILSTTDGGAHWLTERLTGVAAFDEITSIAGGHVVAVGLNSIVRSAKTLASQFRWNAIKGSVFIDRNGNGMKEADETIYNESYKIRSRKINSGQPVITYGYGGQFYNTLDTGVYVTTLEINKPYYTFTSASKSSDFNNYFNEDSINFSLRPVPGNVDLSVSLLPLTPIRPGFPASFRIDYQNEGTEVSAAVLYFVKDRRLNLTNTSLPVSQTSGDTIKWNLPVLQLLEKGSIHIEFQVDAPPKVNNGDTLFCYAQIKQNHNSFYDINPLNNKADVQQIAQGSYDPNDKLEMHNGLFYKKQLDEGDVLRYMIRFQNTGTDTAFNVVIRDTLDINLDWDSVTMIVASHPYHLRQQGEKLEWTFTDIKLPDSTINEPASHGFVVFNVKPKAGLRVGDKIRNQASIYFDFNLPVVTDPVITIIYSPPLPTPLNKIPVADAGRDTIITLPVNAVTLQGNGEDPDGKIIKYSWSKVEGPASFTIDAPSRATTKITSLVEGQYAFELQVTDDAGLTAKDTVAIIVMAAVPPPIKEEPVIWPDIYVYPNPVEKERVRLVGLKGDKKYIIIIRSATGALITRREISQVKEMCLTLPQTAGIYMVSLIEKASGINKLIQVVKSK